MYSKVNETPTVDADSVYRTVVTEYEDQYAEADENVWDAAAIKLTEKANIARHVRRIKSNINGPLPKNRNDFDPESIVENTLGGQKVVVLDSNHHLDSGFGNKLADFNNDEYPQGHGLLSSFIQEDIQNESLAPDDESTEEEYLPEGDDSSMEDESEGRRKPKRIILYTTKRLLKLFAHGRKSSGDGTFKACPSLWKQVYILMIKFNNQWIPVCYAMLPDKTKQSYFTMFYMLQLYMKENGFNFNIESMRMDFEVASMKAVTAAWAVLVCGCYFHFTQAGWRFVQNNHMAQVYLNEADEEFCVFVKSVLALPHVKLADVQDTVQLLYDKEWKFEEIEEKAEFKKKFLDHIQNYWIDGPIPPQVWNCHSRKVDLTNNNNEGHNSYLNNAIKETHPSPAKFTVAIVKELTMAETTLRRFQNGAERMVRAEYKKLNKRRKNLKKLYSTMDRLEYLSRMGNIVMHIQLNKGQMAEVREREERKEQERNAQLDNSDDEEDDEDEDDEDALGVDSENEVEVENRDIEDADSSDMKESFEDDTKSSEDSNHPYSDRVIGKCNANGKAAQEYEKPEYLKKRCLSCNGKFNKRSKYQVCKLCDKLTHVNNNNKRFKMKHYKKDENFICKKCENRATPEGENINTSEETTEEEDGDNPNDKESEEGIWTSGSSIHEELNATYHVNYQCDYCPFMSTTKDELVLHKDEEHNNPCPICEKSFTMGDDMRKHVVDDHGNQNENMDGEYDYNNQTIDGFPCDGLVVETLEQDFSDLHDCPDKQSSMKSRLRRNNGR